MQGFGDITPLRNLVFWGFERVNLRPQGRIGDHRMVSDRVSLLSGIVSISDLAAFITVIPASYWLTTAGQLLHNGRSIA